MKFSVYFHIFMITGLFQACYHEDADKIIKIADLSAPIQLKGTPIILSSPDSLPYIVGKASLINEGYVFYLYDNANFLLLTDTTYTNRIEFAKKGEGPEEIMGVSANYTVPLTDRPNTYALLDPYREILFSYSMEHGLKLEPILDFSKAKSGFHPKKFQILKNGKIVSPRSDMKYGLLSYDHSMDQITEWPLGYDFNNKSPNQDETSIRIIEYSPKYGIIGEVYGYLPYIILHDEKSGEIISKIEIPSLRSVELPNGSKSKSIRSFQMTDRGIWILGDVPDDEENDLLLNIDYNGNVLGYFQILATSSICVDEKRGTILAINPNAIEDDKYVLEYKLPDNLREFWQNNKV